MRRHELIAVKSSSKSDRYSRARYIGDVVRYVIREAIKERYAKDANGREHDELGRFAGQGIKHRQFKGNETIAVTHAVETPLTTRADARRVGNSFSGEHVNTDTGWKIKVTAEGVRHSLQRNANDRRVLSVLPEVIRYAQLFVSEAPQSDRRPSKTWSCGEFCVGG